MNNLNREQCVHAELVRQVLRLAPIGIGATLLNAVILVIVLWKIISHPLLITWLSVTLFLALLRSLFLFKHWSASIQPNQAYQLGQTLVIGLGLSGMIWGLAGIFLFPVDSPTHQTLVVFVLCGMVAGAMSAFSSLYKAFVAFTLPALSPILVRFFIIGDDIHYAMSGMTFIFIILTLFIAKRISATNTELIELKEHLAQMVEERTAELLFINKQLSQEIGERKSAEEKVRESAEHWQITFDAIKDSVCLIDKEGKILQCNKATTDLWGKSHDEIIGHKCWELVHDTKEPMEDYPILRVKKTLKRETVSLPLNDRHFEIIVDPILDEHGKFKEAVHIVVDITDRRWAEEELLKVKKLEATGFLARGIAHDFNNLLSVVLGSTNLARLDVERDGDVYRLLEQAEKAIFRATHLTKKFITLSEGGAPLRKLHDIKQLLTDTVELALSGSNVTCNYRFPDYLWQVEVDRDQLNEVVFNLVANAMEAMPAGGSIEIFARNLDVTSQGHDIGRLLKDGRYVQVSIKDHGSGISKENLGKIFDLYFSTKEMGSQKGMGLGLTIAHSIIKKHDGTISVESTEGVGTTVHIYLPASENKRAEVKSGKKKGKHGQGKLLFMDDEEMLRDTVLKMLHRLGYEEIELASDGTEAIEKFREARQSEDPFDVVILDLTVRGGMGGKEAITELLAIDPSVRAIVTTGYHDDPVLSHFREYGFKGALAKPFVGQALKETLQEVICRKQ